MSDILTFQGRTRWLSNFWPVEVVLDGRTYPSVENAYQAAKWEPKFRKLFESVAPGMAKSMGKGADLPEDWDAIKVQVMRGLLVQKFAPGSKLAAQLIATHPGQLVEGNGWGDTFWGVCKGVGQNMLGKLLMQVREELIAMDAVRSNANLGEV